MIIVTGLFSGIIMVMSHTINVVIVVISMIPHVAVIRVVVSRLVSDRLRTCLNPLLLTCCRTLESVRVEIVRADHTFRCRSLSVAYWLGFWLLSGSRLIMFLLSVLFFSLPNLEHGIFLHH